MTDMLTGCEPRNNVGFHQAYGSTENPCTNYHVGCDISTHRMQWLKQPSHRLNNPSLASNCACTCLD
jgi:hypothetical protein